MVAAGDRSCGVFAGLPSLALGVVFAVLSVCRVMITLCLESVTEMRRG